MTNIYKMSTEDPISGILRFSWTVILQPLFCPFLTHLLIKNIDKLCRLVVAYVYWKVFRLILIFN